MQTDRIEHQPIFVRDVKLAATLATFGATPFAGCPIEKIFDPQRSQSTVFYFENTQDARDMIVAWEKPIDSLGSSNPTHPLNDCEHPFWYVRAALRNRERYLDSMKNARELHHVNKNGKTYLITRDPNRSGPR